MKKKKFVNSFKSGDTKKKNVPSFNTHDSRFQNFVWKLLSKGS